MGERIGFLEQQEKELENEKDEAKKVRDECQMKFDDVMPVLKKAVKQL